MTYISLFFFFYLSQIRIQTISTQINNPPLPAMTYDGVHVEAGAGAAPGGAGGGPTSATTKVVFIL